MTRSFGMNDLPDCIGCCIIDCMGCEKKAASHCVCAAIRPVSADQVLPQVLCPVQNYGEHGQEPWGRCCARRLLRRK